MTKGTKGLLEIAVGGVPPRRRDTRTPAGARQQEGEQDPNEEEDADPMDRTPYGAPRTGTADSALKGIRPSASAYGSDGSDDDDYGGPPDRDADDPTPDDGTDGDDAEQGPATREQVRCAQDAIDALNGGDARGLAEAILAIVHGE